MREVTLNSMHHFFAREDDRGMVEMFCLDIACPDMGSQPCSRPNEVSSLGTWRRDDRIRFSVKPSRSHPDPDSDDRAKSWIMTAEDLLEKAGTTMWCGHDFIKVMRGDYDHQKEQAE